MESSKFGMLQASQKAQQAKQAASQAAPEAVQAKASKAVSKGKKAVSEAAPSSLDADSPSEAVQGAADTVRKTFFEVCLTALFTMQSTLFYASPDPPTGVVLSAEYVECQFWHAYATY